MMVGAVWVNSGDRASGLPRLPGRVPWVRRRHGSGGHIFLGLWVESYIPDGLTKRCWKIFHYKTDGHNFGGFYVGIHLPAPFASHLGPWDHKICDAWCRLDKDLHRKRPRYSSHVVDRTWELGRIIPVASI